MAGVEATVACTAFDAMIPPTSEAPLSVGSTSRQGTTENSRVSSNSLELRLQKRAISNGPEAPFSNFYTPKNDFFYSKSPYMDLDTGRREIRLLRVFPPRSYKEHVEANPHWRPAETITGQRLLANEASQADSVDRAEESSISSPNLPLTACELIDNIPLSRVNADYCALSYCAGKPTDTEVILVNGLPFNAFANLAHAIRSAQEAWEATHHGQELLLWADQICINQRNHFERSDQVQMMREIYRRSDETFICLSTPGCETYLDWIPEQVRASPALSTSGEAGPTLDVLSEFKHFVKTKCNVEGASGGVEEWMDNLETFATCEWWCRSWVYQEFIVSSRPIFLSGSKTIPWGRLFPLVEFITSCLDHFLSSLHELLAMRFLVIEETLKLKVEEQKKTVEMRNEELKKEYELELRKYEELLADIEKEKSLGPTIEKHMRRCIKDKEKEVPRDELYKRIQASVARVQLQQDRVKQSLKRVEECRLRLGEDAARSEEDLIARDGPVDIENAPIDAKKVGPRLDDADDEAENAENEKGSADQLLAEAEKQLAEAEKSLREAEYALKQDKAYSSLLDCTIPVLISAIHDRDESFRCEDVRWEDMEWLVRRLCYSRHCAQHNLPYRFEDNPALWGEPRNNCKCIPRWNCYDGLAAPKTPATNPSAYPEAAPDPPAPPELLPVPVYEGDGLQSKRNDQQERILSVQNRLKKLDLSIMTSMANGKKTLRRPTDLKAALRHSRHCRASDPRDRVYAFLGLADKGYAIRPDYAMENTIVHELINTAQKIIEHENSLDVLYCAPRGRKALGSFLPTWVPDWTSAEQPCSLSRYCERFRKDDEELRFSASRNLPLETAYRREERDDTMVDLGVTGFMIGKLDELEDTVTGYADLQSFLTSRGERVVTSKAALVDDEVWVLHGATMPFVLRPEGEDRYGVVKEALVLVDDTSISGKMFGKTALADLGRKARKIWLL